ncbi:SRPBCC family protein [Longimicrobium sp.]|uniref:SRPBCC family protein n=1 Tax=Longimicrobium sp. TaxID=2029185 RepID=UPI003B3BC359
MPVHRDESGHRYVQAEVEVPGTPEEVWDAIATGPGISSWFVPARVDECVGGDVVCSFGPGMDSLATITAWDPPRRFVADSRDDMGPDAPAVATEWIVEAKAGGTCVVRVVHRWFTDADTWDNQFEGHTYGWQSFFRVLRVYLAHFSGRHGTLVQVMGVAQPPKEEAWAAWTGPLGLLGAQVGQRVSTPDGAPRLGGTVEWAGQPAWPEDLLIRLDQPAPGIAHLVPHPMGGQVFLTLRMYLYGDTAPAAAAEAEAAWTAWMNEKFAPVEV